MAVEFKKIEGDSIQYFALVIILAAVTALALRLCS